MDLYNSSKTPGGTVLAASPATTTGNGDASQSSSPFDSVSSGHRASIFNSAPGNPLGTSAVPTSSPGFSFGVTSPDPKKPPVAGPTFFNYFVLSKAPSVVATPLTTAPTEIFGHVGSTPPATAAASGSPMGSRNLRESTKLFELTHEAFKLTLTGKQDFPANSTTVTTASASHGSLSTSTPSSTTTGFTLGNAAQSSGIGFGLATSAANSSFGLNFGTPASSTSTGFHFTSSATSTATSSLTGPIFGNPVSSTSTGFKFTANTASATAATTSPFTGLTFGITPVSCSLFDFRSTTTSTTGFTSSETTKTSSTGFSFGSAALPSQASLGSATTVTDSSLGDKFNSIRISCFENISNDKDKVKKVPKSSKFTTTFECFFPLVDNDYWIRASKEPKFQENISLSMYRYYMAQHLYARLVQIRASKGLATKAEEKFANHVQSIAPSVPKGIFTYLNAIGDIEFMEKGNDSTVNCHFFEYCSIAWPNDKGHFGKLDHDNHWMYMSFPAPQIVTQAIEEDMDMDDMNPESVWDLRNDLKPLDSHIVKATPNANLLGWKPASVLTISQRQKLQLCGIFQNNFDVINSQFRFNPKIMTIIHDYLFETGGIINVEKYYEKQSQNFGRIEQLAWLEREDDGEDVLFSKAFASVERNVQGMLHPLQRKNEISNKLSIIMGFRVAKSRRSNDWAVYGFKDVPKRWIETRNKVFEFGDVGGVEGSVIECSFRRDALRHKFLVKCYQGIY